jgi:integrase
MADIEHRGDLQWRARIRIHGHPNISKTFSRKKDAEHWAKTYELKIERGETVDMEAQRTTFEEVALRYQAEVTPLKRSGQSEGYRINLLVKRFGPFFLTGLRPMDIAAFRDARLKEVSGQSVIHELNTMSVILEHSRREWGIQLRENPVKLVRKPAKGKARDRRLSALELDYLLLSAGEGEANNMREIIQLALETSCRLGELLALEWSNIDLKKRTLHLRDSKNGDSRTVALSMAAIDTLKGMPRAITGQVFGWKRADSFDKTWRRCVERAALIYDRNNPKKKPPAGFFEDLRFHDLRHEAVSRLFEDKGLNPFEVASMSGHKSMQVLRRYTHLDAAKLATKLG